MTRKAKPIARTEEEVRAFEYWRQHPVEAVKDWFKATPDDWQGDLLNSLFNGPVDRVAMKAAHGPGKSAVLSWAGWIFLNCYPDCRVVATAPTFSQLMDVLWPEFSKWYSKFPDRMKNEWNVSGGHIRHLLNPYDWFAVARTSNRPENLQGFHNANIMILADEASAIGEKVFEVVEGTLSEAGEAGRMAKLLMAGNPNFTAGELYNAFKKNSDLYSLLTITGDPQLLERFGVSQGGPVNGEGRVYFSPRVKERYRQTIARKYGTLSAVYDVRVRGLFPSQSDEAVIPLEWASRATLLPLPPFDPVADPVMIVVDAAREGGNESVIARFRKGYPTKMTARSGTSMVEVANMVEEEILGLHKEGLILSVVRVDEPGVGGGLIDILRSRNIAVEGYHGGEAQEDLDDKRMFVNKKSADWWKVRRLLEQNLLPLPDDEELVNQLASVHYVYTEQEKIRVESKQALKARLGKDASPDRADVIVMGCADRRPTGGMMRDIEVHDVGDDRPLAEMDLW